MGEGVVEEECRGSFGQVRSGQGEGQDIGPPEERGQFVVRRPSGSCEGFLIQLETSFFQLGITPGQLVLGLRRFAGSLLHFIAQFGERFRLLLALALHSGQSGGLFLERGFELLDFRGVLGSLRLKVPGEVSDEPHGQDCDQPNRPGEGERSGRGDGRKQMVYPVARLQTRPDRSLPAVVLTGRSGALRGQSGCGLWEWLGLARFWLEAGGA